MCELFILSQIQLFLEKSNDPNQLPYKKARSTLDAVGLLVHTIAKSLDGGSKVNKAVFEDFSSALNIIPHSLTLDRTANLDSSVVTFLFHQQATTNMPKWSVIFLCVQQCGFSAGSRSLFFYFSCILTTLRLVTVDC